MFKITRAHNSVHNDGIVIVVEHCALCYWGEHLCKVVLKSPRNTTRPHNSVIMVAELCFMYEQSVLLWWLFIINLSVILKLTYPVRIESPDKQSVKEWHNKYIKTAVTSQKQQQKVILICTTDIIPTTHVKFRRKQASNF